MPFHFSLGGLLARPAVTAPFTGTTTTASLRALFPNILRPFSTTPASQKRKKKGKEGPGHEFRHRVAKLRGNLHGYAPPPLRMARNRWLRHWTIHRAWQLHQRRVRESLERERMRMHQGMHSACEELRVTEGPGLKGEGYLYRVALEKKGLYGLNAVPIEYARLQTETPARIAWDHDWKR
ncbi:hypothetical protein SODALDRAFT_113469 [Sodiomyces alkalinus F11]|uniref:Uncharacterized protein n=1 Tax=Sodiomyces alkalinus (strain CBS 110278 / VKM F-3762 / F11) TaxID=1314773 RepID=A0A3N2Q3D0_SODAK|nr:hypothetical protein SODALDRAFT_113469 [Sodiomyces alkalinus F11]ROT41178.1 hypothetical protein SODALDRAFT_113469 [Sodiomyces alkalinus F11]